MTASDTLFRNGQSNTSLLWQLQIQSFTFKRALMQEHFNENYMAKPGSTGTASRPLVEIGISVISTSRSGSQNAGARTS